MQVILIGGESDGQRVEVTEEIIRKGSIRVARKEVTALLRSGIYFCYDEYLISQIVGEGEKVLFYGIHSGLTICEATARLLANYRPPGTIQVCKKCGGVW